MAKQFEWIYFDRLLTKNVKKTIYVLIIGSSFLYLSDVQNTVKFSCYTIPIELIQRNLLSFVFCIV